MKARLIIRERIVYDVGSFAEMVVWQVPTSVPPTLHGFKYRLAYIAGGKRVLGYDNERGKGDHCHIGNDEQPFAFTTVDALLERFVLDVERLRSGE